MRTLLAAFVILLSVVQILLVSSCSSSADRIVGKWSKVDNEAWSEYFADGTVRIYYPKQDLTLGGEYSFLDDGRLKVEMSALGFTDISVYGVSIKGDELTFTYESGKTDVYRRVR